MKNLKYLSICLLFGLLATSCFEDEDDNLMLTANVKDFIWKGMNEFYLYSDNVPDLTNERFGLNGEEDRYTITEEYSNYLNTFSSPEELFNALVFDAGNTDRFSRLFPDLFQIIDALNGTTETNGIRFSVFPKPDDASEVFAVVRLVLNNSNGDIAGVQRNMVVYGVNGTTLNTTNFSELLSLDNATFNFADYNTNGTETLDDDTITPNGQSIMVSKSQFTDNPVHRTEIITEGTDVIGYIMYNSFRNNFETELNDAFAQLQAANVNHLVLDLRYNGGGSILTATRLASMITGQFGSNLYAKNTNGPNRQDQNVNYNFANSVTSGASVNSLNLDKVYVLTTNRSASASELTINSLRSYIDVVQIGTNTTGKTTSNRLVFDSPDFGSQQVSAAHTYALFPLTGNVSNKDDVLVPNTGLVPNFELEESPANFGTLGDPNEPLLAKAIAEITGSGRFANPTPLPSHLKELKTTKLENPIEQFMLD